jgi:peptidoglycan-associated lipoprotein
LLYAPANGGQIGREGGEQAQGRARSERDNPTTHQPPQRGRTNPARLHKENATMQKAPTASLSSGQVAPTIMGPGKDSKEIYILGGLILFLAIVIAAFWHFSQADEAAHSNRSTEALTGFQVSQVLKNPTDSLPVSAPVPVTYVDAAPLATSSSDILHDDIQFEIGRKGLSDDGKASLQRHAEFLKSEPNWGILLQGYTDQQGSMSFNKILGLKRAETVKQQLMALGVPETSIRTVSLGEEGALCIDNSDICRRMNRRVHLEMRKVGQEHMVLPAVVTVPVMEAIQDATEPSAQSDDTLATADGLIESTTVIPESDAAPAMEEPALQTSPQ